jgi:hypothetical protein
MTKVKGDKLPVGSDLPRGAQELAEILRSRKIVTMAELKREFEAAERTLFRRLKQLSYCTSYTHGGSYFSLNEIVEFDADGLWCCESVWFSRHGTMHSTLEAWVTESDNGFFANELKAALHANVKETLLRLVKGGKIVREKMAGRYLYCAVRSAQRKRQILARKGELAAEEPTDELKAAILIFFALLDEQQRRIFAGLESMRRGRGGDSFVAELVGVNVHTVAKGRRQLLERDIDMDRIRSAGGGRPQKKAPRSSRRSRS